MPKMKIRLAVLTCLAIVSTPSNVQAGCVNSWSSRDYKSIGQVQSEIQSRFARARIINVQLCGTGPGARIRVVIDTGRDIKTVTVGAK